MAAPFPVYSIAKPFLAQAVLELAPNLNAEIGSTLPGLAPTFSTRTLGSLLNHTSGLSDYGALPAYHQAVQNREPAWTRDELLERSGELPNNHVGFQYSNVGYLLLRMLVETQTQQTMFQAINELVLRPLAIEGFADWETESGFVPGYDPKWVYSGTFIATEQAIKAGFVKLLKHRAETIGLAKLATAVPYENTGFDHPHYGLGLMMDLPENSHQPTYVGHGGGGPGYSHMILVNPANWSVALETSQTDFNQTDAIRRLREETAR